MTESEILEALDFQIGCDAHNAVLGLCERPAEFAVRLSCYHRRLWCARHVQLTREMSPYVCVLCLNLYDDQTPRLMRQIDPLNP